MPHPYPYPWNRNRDPLALPPGLLRFEVQIQAPASAPGDYGNSVTPDSWQTVLTCMAGIDQISARDSFNGGQLAALLSHVVWIAWTDVPLKSGYRVLCQVAPDLPQRVFLVQAPPENVQERNRIITLRCLEVDATQ